MSRELPGRIGINAIFLEPGMGGLDTYVQELVPELLRAAPGVRFDIYCSPNGARYLRGSNWASGVRFVSHPLFGTRGLKAITELTVLGVLAGREVDLIHSVALTAPLKTRAVNVVTIADTTWLHSHKPDLTTRLWRLLVPPVARRADRIIAISQATADDIVSYLHVPADRIDISHLGHTLRGTVTPLSGIEVRRRFGLRSGPIVLMVGTRKPHKNLLRLLAAMPAVLAARPDAQLVLAGNPTAYESQLRDQISRLALSDNAFLLPFLTPEELEGLYAQAECFVLPSVNEGFGLPVLEAMGRSIPVACSDASALPEVAGDAARYFDPTNVEQIAAAITELLCDQTLRQRLGELGRKREAELTWEATAAATLDCYARARFRRLGRSAG